MFHRLAPLLVLATLAACPGPARTMGGLPALDVARERGRLTLPPGAETRAALARLTHAAEAGDAQAAWEELHFLIDLFDQARFGRDGESRALLIQATGAGEPGAPAAVTDAVLDALLVRADRLLRLDRLHSAGQAARTLLEHDRHAPAARSELYARMSGLKSVARGNGPLAANALLRLAWFCSRSLRDAAAAPARERGAIADHCLYVLYDSDPEPYFETDPARRPPRPGVAELVRELVRLESTIAPLPSRVAALGARLRSDDEQVGGQEPAHLEPQELGVPLIDGPAAPYDGEPLVLSDDAARDPAALAERLRGPLGEDGRRCVVVALRASAPARALAAVARGALGAGATCVMIAVGYPQVVKVPVGDYWYGRANGGKLTRLGVVPLAIGVAAAANPGERGLAPTRGRAWDPARATLGLRLSVTPQRWQLVAPGGVFPPIAVESDAAQARASLREQLASIRAAFPDEDELVLVPDPEVTVATVAEVALAATRAADGTMLFGAIALEDGPLPAARGELAARTRRRAAARVTIVPAALADRAPAVRSCYQDALDRDPRTQGAIVLELGDKGVVVSSPLKDSELKRCVHARLSPRVTADRIATVRVELAD